MFNGIGWQSYWVTLAILAAVYYLFIFLLYYRRDFKLFFLKTTSIHAGESQTDNLPEIAPEFPNEEQDRAEASIVYACLDEVKALFEELKKSKGVKAEILYALQPLLKKYPTLKTSAYKKSITTVILSQCEHICAIRLNKEEVDKVWLG